jgi:NADPH:quinone reductase-like Zn-dependent oxidoreductase
LEDSTVRHQGNIQAFVVENVDDPFVVKGIPRPVAGPGHVLVEIQASGVNPLDLKIRAGKAEHAKQSLPAVLGIDLASILAAVGPGVTEWPTGDEVFDMTGVVGGAQGSFAHYAAVDASLLAKKPAQLGVFTLLPLLTGVGKAHHGDILRETAKLIEIGQLRPCVDPDHFNLSSVEQAHARIASSQGAGKVVVEFVAEH